MMKYTSNFLFIQWKKQERDICQQVMEAKT
jgi:hypothetical protein